MEDFDFNGAAASGALPYIEAGWLVAANASHQTISANTITTINMDTVVHDTHSLGVSVTSNELRNLPAGHYAYHGKAHMGYAAAGSQRAIMLLRNVSDTSYISSEAWQGEAGGYCWRLEISGRFKITATKNLDMQCLCDVTMGLGTGYNDSSVVHTNSTAGVDMRSKLRLLQLESLA